MAEEYLTAQEPASSINYEQITMPEILHRTAGRHPDQTALLFYGSRISYRHFDRMVNRMANALIAMGVAPGDRVGILLPNIPQMAIAVYAVWRTGAVLVMNNPLYTNTELEHQLDDSGTRVLICLDLLAPRVMELAAAIGLRKIIVAHIRDHLSFPKKQIFPYIAKGKHLGVKPAAHVVKWTDLLKAHSDSPPDIPVALEAVAALQYTGGTTGVSKGVVLSHANLSCNAQQGRAVLPNARVGDVVLGSLPIFHAFGAFALNLSVLCGFAVVLIPRPTSDELLKAISKNRCTIFPAVPTMLVGMLNDPLMAKCESVKAFVVAKPGAALNEEAVIEWCRRKLAAYKVPKYVTFMEALPKCAVGKVLRKAL